MQLSPSNTRSYISPPITEATVELRVNKGLTLKEQQKITTKLKKLYPNLQELNELGINIGQNFSGSEVTVSQQSKSFRLASDNQSEIVIVSPQSLIIARLAPYLGWDEFHERVVSAWKIWKSVAGTRSFSRMGVRYINRIDIPMNGAEKIEIKDYLNFYPMVPMFSDAPMTNYFIQVTKPTSNPFWAVNVTSTIGPSPLVNHMSLLLDIDVYRVENIPLNDDSWIILNEARELKNKIFQEIITHRTEETLN